MLFTKIRTRSKKKVPEDLLIFVHTQKLREVENKMPGEMWYGLFQLTEEAGRNVAGDKNQVWYFDRKLQPAWKNIWKFM